MKLIFTLVTFFICFAASAQTKDSLPPPYKRFPTPPPFSLLLSDSTTKFTKAQLQKKKPLLLMLFSPDCSHCQHTAEELLQHKNELKGIQVVMATLHPLWQMNAFVEKYHLRSLPGVTVGKDVQYLLPAFYSVKNLPYMAFYDKKGNLISTFEGGLPVKKALALLKQ